MKRLIKFLKPYVGLILAAIALLFGQANCDLALPDYMSRIVNVGIQQGGVEGAVPDAMRETTMGRLALFMDEGMSARVAADYRLVQAGSSEAQKYSGKYPALAAENVYILKKLDKAERDAIESALAKALLAASGVEKIASDPAAMAAMAAQFAPPAAQGSVAHGGAAQGAPASLPPGMDVFALLKAMSPEQRSAMAGKANEKIAALGPSMTVQAAAASVKAEYIALGRDESGIQLAYMLKTGGVMLVLTLLGAIATILVGFISARVASGLARDLRSGIFTKVEGFSQREFDKFSTASLITRTNNDIMQLQTVVVMMIRMVFYAPIIGIGGIIKALGKDSSMWWIIALAVGVIVVLISVVFKVAVPRFKIMQKLVDRLNLVSREDLSGMMVIRAFNMQGREEERFDKANKDLTGNMLFVNRVMVIMMPAMMLIMNAVSLLIIWIGSEQVAQSSMQVGDMMAFMQYAMQIFFAFIMMSMMFIMLPRAAVSAERVSEVLGTEGSINDPESPTSFGPDFAGTVEFRNVSFRYPGAEEDVLHDISFTARPGQTTAIIGATGSGKSSVVSLLPRFYDASSGKVLVGGVDVRELKQAELRDRIGYVPQKASLFSGTIESNLRYADEGASAEAIETAARIAQASEFIKTSPEGMATPISQGGTNVSGGQKQRLSIARALVKKPPIYVFDDSFSALDFKTDSALRRALKEETGEATVIIVTQRVATVKKADQIVVIDEGSVVGIGSHDELMKSCETYREIATSQLSEEELR
jgi:ATP-binding cassette, subfamily B, multidrug efflux pump